MIAVATYYFVYGDSTQEHKENVLGIICMFLNIMTIGSPLLDVVEHEALSQMAVLLF